MDCRRLRSQRTSRLGEIGRAPIVTRPVQRRPKHQNLVEQAMAETDYFSITLTARPVYPYVVSDLAAQETVCEDGVDPTLVWPLYFIMRRRAVTWSRWSSTALQRCRSSRTSIAVTVTA